MRIMFAVLMMAFFTAAVAHARVGETFDQCVKRYGAPVAADAKLIDQRSGMEVKQFIKEGVLVKVIFSGDKAIYVEYDYCTLKLQTGENNSSDIIKKLLDANGKDWKADSTSNNRDWLLEINDNEGVIASSKVEPGMAKDRWICEGGPEKGGLIAVKSSITCGMIIANAEYMNLVLKNQPKYIKEREAKVKNSLESF